MARYGQAFKDRAVARLLPPESAAVEVVAREIGVGARTLERWREQARARPARGRAWTAAGRLEAVVTTAGVEGGGRAAGGAGAAAARPRPAPWGGAVWSSPGRLEAVITTAGMDEAGKS